MSEWGHLSHVNGPEPVEGPGAAARLLAMARRRAGLTQSELARRSGVSRPFVNRIERGRSIPRSDVLVELLRHSGASLTTQTLRGTTIDRRPIHDMLRLPPGRRISNIQYRVLRVVAFHGVTFLVVGAAAARLNGAPIDAPTLELLVRPDPKNLHKLHMARRRHWIRPHLRVTLGWDRLARRCAWLLGIVGSHIPRQIRVACIDDLVAAAGPDHVDLLHAVLEELDGGVPEPG